MRKFHFNILFIFTVLIVILLSYSCRKDKISNFGKLEFSKDTVIFDTVFTQIGSITKQLKVYNNNKNDLNIKSIYIENNSETNFRLNIDGFSENDRNNIVIRSNDSMYIFVEVTVDPTGQDKPMIIEDAIVFETENNTQKVKLIAWGQDAHIYIFKAITESLWRDDKPYLIFGNAWVDSGKTLTIDSGVRVHFYTYSSLVVLGTLNVNGTKDVPVTFQGHRLDDVYEGYTYQEIPGQWGTIAFIEPSVNNKINYAIIKNGSAGFQIGHPNYKNNPDITITNTIIDNMSGTGIYAFGVTIEAQNLVISNCANELLGLYMGGSYNFVHCTFANYWNVFRNFSTRKTSSVILSNYIFLPVYDENYNLKLDKNNEPVFDYYEGKLTKANFSNCIIYGDIENELVLADTNTIDYEYEFNNCLIKIDKDFDTTDSRFNTIYTKVDSLFKNVKDRNYELHPLSGAINKGSVEIAKKAQIDYNGNNRLLDGKPDLGAYEFTEK